MDPITVILSALAVAGGKLADQAVRDGYEGLKSLILRKFGRGQPRLEERLDDYVADQETFQKPAEKALREAGADADQEVLERAVELLRRAEQVAPGVTGIDIGRLDATNVVVAQRIEGGVHQSSSWPPARPEPPERP
jgi:hypothetical protein